jgi:RAB protein geranylgeranyltransferase component A
VCPQWTAQQERKEGLAHGPGGLLWRSFCQSKLDSGECRPSSFAIESRRIAGHPPSDSQLFKKFRDSAAPDNLGRDRDYAVDLIPKFILASGTFTRMLVHTDVVRYLEFKQIAGSYVYRDGRINKVPSNESEALRSSLMGLFEKRRARSFFMFLQNWKDNDPATHQGQCEVVSSS